jgi:hypothetical protein
MEKQLPKTVAAFNDLMRGNLTEFQIARIDDELRKALLKIGAARCSDRTVARERGRAG